MNKNVIFGNMVFRCIYMNNGCKPDGLQLSITKHLLPGDAFLWNALLCGELHFLPDDTSRRIAFFRENLYANVWQTGFMRKNMRAKMEHAVLFCTDLRAKHIPLGMYRSVEKQSSSSNLHSVGMHPIITHTNK